MHIQLYVLYEIYLCMYIKVFEAHSRTKAQTAMGTAKARPVLIRTPHKET